MSHTPPNPSQRCIYCNLSRSAGITINIAHGVVLSLSLALILFISYDTFAGIPFLDNKTYMTFQFWVCMIFITDFFLELALSHNKRRYLLTRFCFLLISIPYLNILALTDIRLSSQALYFIRFIPLVRGAYSLAMVVGYFSDNKAANILSSYAAILFSIIYFASLIFYNQEKSINPDVKDYWEALWWACMNVTTIGCYINPMSIAGKICGATLAGCGMLMLPLFTVFVTSMVERHKERSMKVKNLIETAIEEHR